jgi:molybdopterin synthase catalytic subunit
MHRCGAVSSFFGTTRDTFEGKIVTHLEYEAYPDMALLCMFEICDKIRSKWDVSNIIIQHKLGPCPVLETSIAIIISSEHRKESLEGVHYAIDELKRMVPIWKKVRSCIIPQSYVFLRVISNIPFVGALYYWRCELEIE